jgi:DNA-binding SARP family transcriptional activator/predicted ATPase
MNTLQLQLIDGFALCCGAQLIAVPTEKARALISYLAVSRQAEPRAALAALFWPHLSEAAAAANLTQTIWLIRRATAVYGSDPLQSDQQTLQLRSDTVTTDIAAVDTADQFLAGHDHRDVADCPACLQLLRHAVRPMRQGFAIGLELRDAPAFNEWLQIERERRRRRHVEHLTLLAQLAAREQEYVHAAQDYEQALRFDPYNEQLQRGLLRVLALSGRRAAALERYAQLTAQLQQDLQVAPEPATQQLAGQIRRDALPAPLLPPLILPYQPQQLFGRETELQVLHKLIGRRNCRLVTISGVGGVGKTTLAAAAAPLYRSLFADGICFVSLAEINEPQTALSAVAAQLSRCLPLAADSWDELALRLIDRRLLLILDNVEPAAALRQAIGRLLEQVPGLIILATARRRLALPAEQLLTLHGLDVRAGERPGPSPAVELLLSIAGRSVAADQLPDRATAAQICRLLGGLPLAVELAARSLRGSSSSALLALLQQQPQQLSGDSPDLPVRHRRIGLLFARSFHELAPATQTALTALLLCHGGFTPAAAAAVIGAGAGNALGELRERGLLMPLNGERSAIHPLIRFFAESAGAHHDRQAARQRHAAYYLAQLAQTFTPAPGSAALLPAQLADDFANLADAWRFTAAAGASARLAGLAAPLAELALHNARYRECIELLELPIAAAAAADAALLHVAVTRVALQQNALAQAERHAQAALACSDSVVIRIQALRVLAQCHSDCGRPQPAAELYQQALALAPQVPARIAALVVYSAGRHYSTTGQLDSAEPLLLRARDLARSANDGPTEVRALDFLAQLPARRGDLHASLPLLEAALTAARERGDVMLQMTALNHLATLRALCDQPPEQFVPLFEEALQLARARLLAEARIDLLHSSGYSFARIGRTERAAELLHEGLLIAQRIGMQPYVLEMIEGFGMLAVRSGRPQTARRCLQLVIAHPATMAFTRRRAAALLAELPPGPQAAVDDSALQQLIGELLAASPA